jgi:hypothetical protein
MPFLFMLIFAPLKFTHSYKTPYTFRNPESKTSKKTQNHCIEINWSNFGKKLIQIDEK